MTRAVNNKFFETRDYSMFKKVRGNRPVDQAHVQQLKKLIADKDLMDPIRVNANIEVVDGQHTLQARKELGLPVPYIIINSDDPLDVARLNQGRKNWSLDHFLGHHCARGKMDYKICKSKIFARVVKASNAFCFRTYRGGNSLKWPSDRHISVWDGIVY